MIKPDKEYLLKLLQYCESVEKISKPLSLFNITFFEHIRIFKNGAKLYFCNHKEWLKYFLDNDFFAVGNFSAKANYNVSHVLWDYLPQDGVLDVARDKFDISNGFTIIDNHDDYADYYLFASDKNNKIINNFYINHIQVLRHFINYYKYKMGATLEQIAKDFHAHLNKRRQADALIDAVNNEHELVEQFFVSTSIKKYSFVVNEKVIKLSPRQYQCLKLITEGWQTKSIANHLGISPRTCEAYIDTIKNKFSCPTRESLLKLIKKLL